MWNYLTLMMVGRCRDLRLGLAGCLVVGLIGCQSGGAPANKKTTADLDRTLTLTLRDRVPSKKDPKQFVDQKRQEVWQANETALIVIDMWDKNRSPNAMRRVAELAPRMNQMLHEARRRGVLIIHAPSGCMKFYRDHPARQRVAGVPKSKSLPARIDQWCRWGSLEEKMAFPIDHSDGGFDDDPTVRAKWLAWLKKNRGRQSPWERQIKSIDIDPKRDYITDSGVENWSIQEHHGIKNVLVVGVYANLCVVGRPFGLHQMSKNGRNTVLIRDMTDVMYNSKSWPFVDHYAGLDLVVRHLERFVVPTVTSGQVMGDGQVFRFTDDSRPVPASARLD